jgi:rare lipoprotein A (peptidoglycan hydrolase)
VRQSAASSAAGPAATTDGDTNPERIAVRSRTTAKVAGRHALLGRTVHVKGTVTPAGAKRRVVVRIGRSKKAVRAGRNGRFSAAWRAPSTGTYPVRVKARGNRLATGSGDKAGRVTVYRRAAASWYGPGLYGNRTACGGTLTPGTVGVAHKSMPCGTRLTLRYGSRSVRVRVIDRGPYSGNREFDLTAATKQRLGFPDTGTVLTSR